MLVLKVQSDLISYVPTCAGYSVVLRALVVRSIAVISLAAAAATSVPRYLAIVVSAPAPIVAQCLAQSQDVLRVNSHRSISACLKVDCL